MTGASERTNRTKKKRKRRKEKKQKNKSKRKKENIDEKERTGEDSYQSDDTIPVIYETETTEEDNTIKTSDLDDLPKLQRSRPSKSNGIIWQLVRYNCNNK
jgi:type III secretory pathway component EscV